MKEIMLSALMLGTLTAATYLMGHRHGAMESSLDTSYAAGYLAGQKALLEQLGQFDELGVMFLTKCPRYAAL